MTMDDTIRTGRQAEEDLLLALIEQGLSPVQIITPDNMDAIPENALVFIRIRREWVEQGCDAGIEASRLIKGMPSHTHGRLALTFDGWADDPRELYEIPIVVDFCRGLLLGPPPIPDKEHARVMLTLLVEDALWFLGEKEDPTPAGSLWLIGAAFPEQCYHSENGQPFFDLGMAAHIRDYFVACS